jgi:hypothetical protein
MMIMVPHWITPAIIDESRKQVQKVKNPPSLPLVQCMDFLEGLCVQIMHIGSYDDEAPTIRRLHAEFMPANGLAPNGKHHEIYLGDPRKVAPEKLRTVLRQPVKSTGN